MLRTLTAEVLSGKITDALELSALEQLIRLAIEYAKEHLNATKIELAVFENNESARRCYEAVGFTEYAKSEYKMPIGTWNCTEMRYRFA